MLEKFEREMDQLLDQKMDLDIKREVDRMGMLGMLGMLAVEK